MPDRTVSRLSERIHERAMILKEMVSGGTEDILRIVFGAKKRRSFNRADRLSDDV